MQSWLSRYFTYLPATALHGENVFRYLRAARRFQYLPREAIESFQLSALRSLVSFACRNSAYYRHLYSRHGVDPEGIAHLEDLPRLPQISKKDLAENLDEIMPKYASVFAGRKTTGGSTGQAVTLWKNPQALARERAVTARSYEWAGIHIGDSQARFWGVPLDATTRFKYQVIDFLANRRRYSAFSIDDSLLLRHYDQISQFKPRYLYGYVSMLADFADFVHRSKLKPPQSLIATITTSEVLTPAVRELLQSTFGVPVFNEYGCGEVGSIAHQCDHGAMHVMEDNLLIEFEAVPGSDSYELIVTDLFNYATPIIRYRIGDFATPCKSLCTCGRTLRTLQNIHGRAYDRIVTPDGKRHHPEKVMYIFESLKEKYGSINQFQFVQDSITNATLKIVKGKDYSDGMEAIIKSAIAQELHSSIEVRFEYVNQIERERSGKLRVIQSRI